MLEVPQKKQDFIADKPRMAQRKPLSNGHAKPAATSGYRQSEPTKKDKEQNSHLNVNPNQSSGLHALLSLEAEARSLSTERDLLFAVANNPRRLLGYRQSFVFKYSGKNTFKIAAISSVASIDRTTPLIRWAEALVGQVAKETDRKKVQEFQLPAFCDEKDVDTQSYPFRNALYVPMLSKDGEVIGACLKMRDTHWNTGDVAVIERLCGTYAHAWAALMGTMRKPSWRFRFSSIFKASLLVVLGIGAFFPVPLSTLAPVEVAAKNPFVISSPLDAIISDIPVPPNGAVHKGDIILRFNDTELRNKLDVATRDVEVAEARLWRANQAAFSSNDAKRELAITRAELRLRKAERQAISDELERTIIRAPRNGVLIYKDKRDLIGKPVSIGQRVMRIANPDQAEFRIELPVADAILVEQQSAIRVFLDTDPLNAIDAELTGFSYHAQPTADQTLAYRLSAKPIDINNNVLRIGSRGSAKLVGENVPLYFYLFRKPIATIRQWTGF